MRFEKLNEMIPHVVGTKKHVVSMSPYNAITLAMPGRHQHDTPAPGADFVVMVDDENMEWVKHQFTHTDIFKDLELKAQVEPIATGFFMSEYLKIIQGADPSKSTWDQNFVPVQPLDTVGIHPYTLLHALQCLAVAEHRRYAKFENKFGGRFLPFRFSTGITEGLWKAEDAINMQRRGRPGVEILEKIHGTPVLTKELCNASKGTKTIDYRDGRILDD